MFQDIEKQTRVTAPPHRAPADAYRGYFFSERAQLVMQQGRILPSGMCAAELLDRVVRTVTLVNRRYSSTREARAYAERLGAFIEDGACILGTPALTNIGLGDRPAASCAAVPIDVHASSTANVVRTSEKYYLQNMGSGYNLDQFTDPVCELIRLNNHAHNVQFSGTCERYVGNMAHISVYHPRVREFVGAKMAKDMPHFNLSIDYPASAIDALGDTESQEARLLRLAADAAWQCGDPGVLSMDRFNETNPLVGQSRYVTTAPCAEVGLAAGDTCVFGYINVAAFLRSRAVDDYDWEALREAVDVLARCLDGLVDMGSDMLPDNVSRAQARMKRRIGISVCGYSDLLLWTNTPYGSSGALSILCDVMGFIQYHARLASVRLAESRGAFPMHWVSRWTDAQFRSRMKPTRHISEHALSELDDGITRWGVRNSVATASPPSGRSSLLLGAYQSIEPPLHDPRTKAVAPSLRARLAEPDINPDTVRAALDIPWREHLDTLTVTNAHVDEGVSKTINLPHTASVQEVEEIYKTALAGGLRAVSVYRPPAPSE